MIDAFQFPARHHMTLPLLTHSRSWALLEKLPVVELLENFPAFYGTRRFITASTWALHRSLSWARSIQSLPSHPTPLQNFTLSSIRYIYTHAILRSFWPMEIIQCSFHIHIIAASNIIIRTIIPLFLLLWKYYHNCNSWSYTYWCRHHNIRKVKLSI
jgi:hypothetical protein